MKKTNLSSSTLWRQLMVGIILSISLLGCNIKEKKHHVRIKTPYGEMIVELYNQTPKHRDNFIKLTERKFYDGLLFHRVIDQFMIQGGDPDSRGAEEGARLGNGGPGYDIEAEIRPELFHKKGVIAAAREGDRSNPQRASSGSQFYIVQGKRFTEEELDSLEDEQFLKESRQIFKKKQWVNKDSILFYQQHQMYEKIEELRERLHQEADSIAMVNRYSIPENHRKIYKKIGGTPHLDGKYTVFGEVIKGKNIIDSIASVRTNLADRPLKDIQMIIELVD